MKRAVLLVVLVSITAGCTDTRQHAAALAVGRHANATARCTRNARMLGGTPVDTRVYICNVKSGGGLCDRYRATLTREGFDVKLQARRVDCVLPP